MISLLPSAWALLSSFAVFCFGAVLVVGAGRVFEVGSKRALLIYLWHSIFCVLYAVYISKYNGDAGAYYLKALSGEVGFKVGSGLVALITYPLVAVFGFGFLAASLCFNVVGSIGLVACDACFRKAAHAASGRVRRLAALLVFLPSMSYWSSAIGKDSLAFLSVGLALWSSMLLPRRALGMALAILIMLAVRPHIAGIMVLALAAAIVIDGRVSLVVRLMLAALSLAGAAWLVPFAISYVGLGSDLDAAELQEYIARRQGFNLGGGSSVNISSMPFPMQLFTYVFRPLPFEAHNATSFASSLENVLLLAVLPYGMFRLIRRWRSSMSDGRMFMLFYAGICWVLCALTTANLGIAVRQKWMFVPVLIVIILGAFARRKGTASRGYR